MFFNCPASGLAPDMQVVGFPGGCKGQCSVISSVQIVDLLLQFVQIRQAFVFMIVDQH